MRVSFLRARGRFALWTSFFALLALRGAADGPATNRACAPTGLPSAVQAAFERTREICRQVETIRGLKFTNDVRVVAQPLDEFRAYVKSEMREQYGAEGLAGLGQALVKLGVLERPVNLEETYLAILESQVAAHYNPQEKTYCLIRNEFSDLVLDAISAHELCHALQDQRFGLDAFLKGDLAALRDNQDATLAKQCLVEGEATWVMTVWTTARQMQTHNLTVAQALTSIAIALQAALPLSDILELTSTQWRALGDEAMAEGLDELKKQPRFLVESLFAAYTQGALMVDLVKKRQGWSGVDMLYRNPPRSTEQILHVDKLMSDPRDEPTDVRLPDLPALLPEGCKLVEEDVLGELGIRILLSLWIPLGGERPPLAASAAEGWGGDRFYYFRGPQDADLLVWKTVWDSEDDAREFAVACRLMLRQRFPGLKTLRRSGPETRTAHQVWEVEPGRHLKLAAEGTTVGIVDATRPEFLDLLWR